MSFFVKPTDPSVPKNNFVRYAAIVLAAMFVVLAVAQLYSYEDFPNVMTSLGLYGGRFFAHIYAALLVVGEVIAIPFLLSMRLSPAMRIVSMMASWCVVASWLSISFFINLTTNAITNSGVLGATIPIAPGWWMIVAWMVISGLCIWVSWGMWPTLPVRRNQ